MALLELDGVSGTDESSAYIYSEICWSSSDSLCHLASAMLASPHLEMPATQVACNQPQRKQLTNDGSSSGSQLAAAWASSPTRTWCDWRWSDGQLPVHPLTRKARKNFPINHRDQRLFSILNHQKSIIYSFCRYVWIHMLWVYGH